jgi:hypothetical protein
MTKRKLLVAGIQSDRGIVLVIFSEVRLQFANPAEGKHRQVDKKCIKFADNIIQPTIFRIALEENSISSYFQGPY